MTVIFSHHSCCQNYQTDGWPPVKYKTSELYLFCSWVVNCCIQAELLNCSKCHMMPHLSCYTFDKGLFIYYVKRDSGYTCTCTYTLHIYAAYHQMSYFVVRRLARVDKLLLTIICCWGPSRRSRKSNLTTFRS